MTSIRANLERDLKRAQIILTRMQEEKIYSLPEHPVFKIALTTCTRQTFCGQKPS